MTGAVVIGRSHSAAIAEALATVRQSVTGVTVHRLHDENRPYLQNTITPEEAVDMVAALPPGTRVFLSTLGTYHNILGLLRSGPTFDVLLDGEERPDPAAEVQIPSRALEVAFQQHLKTSAFIRKIRSASHSKVVLLSTPPPKQCNDFLLDRFLEQKKQLYRGRSVEEIGIERPESRLKLWQMETRALERWAPTQRLKFLAAPPEAFDENGFLKPRFYSDATHANAEYGALVVDQICRIVERTRSRVANG